MVTISIATLVALGVACAACFAAAGVLGILALRKPH
jgi:hypothetical protein